MTFDTRAIGFDPDTAWDVANDVAHTPNGHVVIGAGDSETFILVSRDDHPGVMFCARAGEKAAFLPFAWGSEPITAQVRFLSQGLSYCEVTGGSDTVQNGDANTDNGTDAEDPGAIFVAMTPDGAEAANNGRIYRDASLSLALIANDISCLSDLDSYRASSASYLDSADFGMAPPGHGHKTQLPVPSFMSHGAFLAVMMGGANPYVIGAFQLGEVTRHTQPITGKDYYRSTVNTGTMTLPVYLPADADGELDAPIATGAIVVGTWLMTGRVNNIADVLTQW